MRPPHPSMPPYTHYAPSSDHHIVAAVTRLEIHQQHSHETMQRIEGKQDQILQEVSKPPRRLPEWMSPPMLVWITIICVSLIGNLTTETQKQLLGLLEYMPK